MHFSNSFLLIFLTVYIKESLSGCFDKFALSSVDVLVHRRRNERASVLKDENFNLLDDYISIDVTRANISQLCEGTIKNFGKLETLSLINLNLTLIEPRTFQHVPKLKELSLSVNRITMIQRGVFNIIQSLQVVYLTNNEIATIEDGAFGEMPELKAVHLDHNKITELSGNVFFGSPKIALLDFSFNKIKTISKFAFDDIRSDRTLPIMNIFLKKNEITAIDSEALKEQIPLNLHLEGNQISRIAKIVFSVKEGSTIYLTNNKVNCVGDDAIEWIKAKNIKVDLKSNPVDCGCLERIEGMLDGEMRGELNVETTLNCQQISPFGNGFD